MYDDIVNGFDEVWSRVQRAKEPRTDPRALIASELGDARAFSEAAARYPRYRNIFRRLSSEELSHARMLRAAFGIYGNIRPAPHAPVGFEELIKLESDRLEEYAALSEKNPRRGLFRRLYSDEKRHLRELSRIQPPKFDLPKEWGSSSERR